VRRFPSPFLFVLLSVWKVLPSLTSFDLFFVRASLVQRWTWFTVLPSWYLIPHRFYRCRWSFQKTSLESKVRISTRRFQCRQRLIVRGFFFHFSVPSYYCCSPMSSISTALLCPPPPPFNSTHIFGLLSVRRSSRVMSKRKSNKDDQLLKC
jgi:hypothetical protein